MKEIENKRNGKIDLLKFIFCIFIILGHLNSKFGNNPIKYMALSLNNQYQLGVDFFFIVSGYFLLKSANKITSSNIILDTLSYIKKRILSFLPEHLISYVLTLLVNLIISYESIKNAIYHIIISIPSLFLLDGWGLSKRDYMLHEWYLFCLIIVIIFIFPILLKHNKTFTRIICPIISIFLLVYLIKNTGDICDISKHLFNDMISVKIVRSFSEVMLGICLYELVDYIRKLKLNNSLKIVLTIIEAISLLFCLFVINQENRNLQIYYLLFLCIFLVITLSEISLTNKLFNYDFFYILGKLSLPMYLSQMAVINFFVLIKDVNMDYFSLQIFVIILSLIISSLIMVISDRLRKYSRKYKRV